MARFTITVDGNGLQQRSVDKLVKSLNALRNGISISVTKEVEATSRAARLDAAMAQVEEGKSEIESLRDELQEWYDNLPENFQSGEKADSLQSAIDALETLISELESIDAGSVEFPGMFG